MKSSKYNIYFAHRGIDYVYNTLSCAIVSLDESIKTDLINGSIGNMSFETISILRKNGILVPLDLDELNVYKYYYQSVQFNESPKELRLVILPTYQCNLRCTYCFEEDCKNIPAKLNDSKIEGILSFVESELSDYRRNYESISLTLFGGEPFIAPKECLSLVMGLAGISNCHNLKFRVSAITNATLIDDWLIDTLIVPYKVRLQITIDGLKEHHDSKRKYSNGQGTFDKIEKVVERLNEKGCKSQIDLRLNIDKSNQQCIEKVFSRFHSKTGYMYVGLLRAAGNNGCNVESCIDDNSYITEIRPQILDSIKQFKAATRYVPFGKQSPCAMTRRGCFIIDPLLDVYTCDNLVGQPKYSIGKLENGRLIKHAQFYQQSNWSPFDNLKCSSCKLLPACGKGCAYKCLLAEGDMNTPHCFINERLLTDRIKAYLDEVELAYD